MLRRFILLDNGGKTADRYTLFDTYPLDGRILFVTFNDSPGFGRHGEIVMSLFNAYKRAGFRALGRSIRWEDISSESAQRFAQSYMQEDPPGT